MKLGQLVRPEFQSSLNGLMSKEIPITLAFRLKGAAKKVVEEINKYDEVRKDLLNKLSKKDAEGKPVTNDKGEVQFESPDKFKEFTSQLEELLKAEVEVGSIKAQELGDKASVTAQDLFALDGFIVE